MLQTVNAEGSPAEQEFYCRVLRVLNARGVPYMVGGSFAAAHYTGRTPHTKDIDIFLPPEDVDSALAALSRAGFEVERPYPFWLAKGRKDRDLVDLISRAASGLWEVEREWVDRSPETTLWSVPTRVCAVEELIWTKSALMDRDRYDGNDVMHLLQARAFDLDWDRLRHLAGSHWRLLLVHLTMFGYVYPDLIPLVPRHLLAELSLRLLSEKAPDSDEDEPLCRGTLISNYQYLTDVEELGYRDARLAPHGLMTREDLRPWLEAVKSGNT